MVSGAVLDSLAALEGVIGKTPPAVHLKVIDHLDPTALHWLATSPLMFAGFGDGGSIRATMAGGAPGFARGEPAVLRLPLELFDDASLVRPGLGFGSLFLAPGIGETLRVNGRVAAVGDGEAVIRVEECYVHCAKALIRSGFWGAERVFEEAGDLPAFVGASRFMALATIDPHGGADLSPKGDPAGLMARLGEGALWFADRPGNRRVDSFRNIVAQPEIAALLLVPGSCQVAVVTGRAQLTTDEKAGAAFTVQGKMPLLVTRVDEPWVELRKSEALGRAGLWPVGAKAEGINPARMFAKHLKLNRDKGLSARIASAVVSIPGLMQKGLEKDYKSNLY